MSESAPLTGSVRLLFSFCNFLRRNTLCRLGYHGPQAGPDGTPANFCGFGCGHAFNPNAYQKWRVTLNTGETFEVKAINEYHATSVVVYGGSMLIDGASGKALAPVRIHRDNIGSVEKLA